MPVDETKYPFYAMVPKDYAQNVSFRIGLLEWANAADRVVRLRRRTALWRACSRDILFWINCFGWLIEPRSSRKFLWITYPFQDEAIDELATAIQTAIDGDPMDVVQSKSRDMGASWMCVAVLLWFAMFRKDFSALLLSRKADLADSEDPKSLFAKIDLMIRKMPKWMLPRFKRKEMLWKNEDRDSYLKADTTNEFAGIADRTTALLLDEFSLMQQQSRIWSGTRDVSRCRIANFTMRANALTANRLTRPDSDPEEQTVRRCIRLHWTKHPAKVRGLYQADEAGNVTIIDKDYVFPPDYRFRLDGKQRSPWYDKEEKRCATQTEMDTEVDMMESGGAAAFFDHKALKKIEETVCRNPLARGDLFCRLEHYESPDFDPRSDPKPLSIWRYLIGDMRAPSAQYVIGADIGAGVGATNSVLAVWDVNLGEKVAKYVSNSIDARTFAERAVMMAWFFADHDGTPALLKWEANGGPGAAFGKRIMEVGFRNVYLKTDEKTLSKRTSDKPGWWSNDERKTDLLKDYAIALRDGRAVNYDQQGIEECRQYFTNENGIPEHVEAANTDDPNRVENNHGDHVIADALAWSECKVKEARKIVGNAPAYDETSLSTFEGRMRYHERLDREKDRGVKWWNSGPYGRRK